VSADPHLERWNARFADETYHFGTAPNAFLASQRALLKPGGLLVLEGYHPDQVGRGTGGPPKPDNLYTAQMLRDAFDDWAIIDLAERETVLNEGRAHVGPSAVVDLVARKPVT
jgi:hypothetical protein